MRSESFTSENDEILQQTAKGRLVFVRFKIPESIPKSNTR